MTVPADVLARIVAPHFVCGVELRDGVVITAAPIVKFMIGWDARRVHAYVTGKGWTVARVPPSTSS